MCAICCWLSISSSSSEPTTLSFNRRWLMMIWRQINYDASLCFITARFKHKDKQARKHFSLFALASLATQIKSSSLAYCAQTFVIIEQQQTNSTVVQPSAAAAAAARSAQLERLSIWPEFGLVCDHAGSTSIELEARAMSLSQSQIELAQIH